MKNSKLDKQVSCYFMTQEYFIRISLQLNNITKFIRIRDELAEKGENRATVTLQLTFMEVNLSEIPEVSNI